MNRRVRRAAIGAAPLALLAIASVAVGPAAARVRHRAQPVRWSSEALPAGLGPLSGIACQPTRPAAHCVAVGEDRSSHGAVVVSDDGGKSWTATSVPSGVGFLADVACSGAADCWAVGKSTSGNPAVIATTNGGTSWRRETLPAAAAPGELGRISCVGHDCWVVQTRSNALLVTRDGGASWSVEDLQQSCHTFLCGPAFTATDVTFVNYSDGYASGYSGCGGFRVTQCPGIVWRTTDGGRIWRPLRASLKLPSVDAISCVDASHCWAAAATFTTGEMYGTADGGARWSHQTLPRFGGYFNDIRCERAARVDRCFAVGQNEKGTAAVIVQTTDGGYHWLRDPAPRGTGALGAASFIGIAGRAVGESSTQTGPVALASSPNG